MKRFWNRVSQNYQGQRQPGRSSFHRLVRPYQRFLAYLLVGLLTAIGLTSSWEKPVRAQLSPICLPNIIYVIALGRVQIASVAPGGGLLPLVSPTTGATLTGTLPFAPQAVARDPLSTNRLLYYVDPNGGRIGTWDPTNDATTVAADGSIPAGMVRMAFSNDGVLYAMTIANGDLYTISTGTGLGRTAAARTINSATIGTTTLIGTLGVLNGTGGDMAFDPNNPNELYISNGALLVSVNINNPTAILAQGNPGLPNSPGLAFSSDGSLYAGVQDPAGDYLIRLDTTPGGFGSQIPGSRLPYTGTRAINDFATVPVADPVIDLAATKTTPQPTVAANGSISYSITVTNNGACLVRGVAITDTVPAQITGVTWQGQINGQGTFPTPADQSGTGNTINTLVNLGAGSTVVYTITGTAPNAATTLTNTVTATPPQGVLDPNPGNNTSSATVNVVVNPPSADLSVTKQVNNAVVAVGQQATYTITVTNNGPAAATAVEVTDPLPAGLSFVSATPSQGTYNSATGLWTIGTLANGVQATLQVVATVTAATPSLTNTATVRSTTPDPNPGNNTSQAVINQPFTLNITKVASRTVVPVGQSVTFTVTVTNNGPANATAVQAIDRLSAGFALISATPSQGTYDGATGVWTVGALANGASATLQIAARVTVPGRLENIASIPNLTNPNLPPRTTPPVVVGTPNLRLVKRITAITRSGVTIGFNQFVDNPNDSNDNAAGWIGGSPLGITQVDPSQRLTSGDEIEYTVYFLSDGAQATVATNVCDAIPPSTTFISNSIRIAVGNNSPVPGGAFVPPLSPLPVDNGCTDQSNSNGSVLASLGDVPAVSPNNTGFIRFRVKIK